MRDKVKTYLNQLRQTIPYVPPIREGTLKAFHKARDYEGMVRFIRRTMNVGVRLRVGWVNDEGSKSEGRSDPAWVRMPEPMPFYGSTEFRELTIPMFLRKSFLQRSEYDQVAIAVAHELSHVVLHSLGHPLREEEEAVDLTAMLLGFRRLYASGCYKERRSQNRVSCQTLGYLARDEVEFVNRALAQSDSRPRLGDKWLQGLGAVRTACPTWTIWAGGFGLSAIVGVVLWDSSFTLRTPPASTPAASPNFDRGYTPPPALPSSRAPAPAQPPPDWRRGYVPEVWSGVPSVIPRSKAR